MELSSERICPNKVRGNAVCIERCPHGVRMGEKAEGHPRALPIIIEPGRGQDGYL